MHTCTETNVFDYLLIVIEVVAIFFAFSWTMAKLRRGISWLLSNGSRLVMTGGLYGLDRLYRGARRLLRLGNH